MKLPGRSRIAVCLAALLSYISTAQAIDCFKCVSMNGRFAACDDPFHNNHSLQMLESPCMGGRKGRDGLFPATSCIKIAGVFDDTGESITVRGCGLDSGTVTTDTEIVRMSHCGRFYYNDRMCGEEEETMEHLMCECHALVRQRMKDFGTGYPDPEEFKAPPLSSIIKHMEMVEKALEYVHGCLQSCNDADACNSAPLGGALAHHLVGALAPLIPTALVLLAQS